MDKDLHKAGRHTISQDEFPHWASERISMHEQLIAALVGRYRALQYGVGMIIGAHPEPERLLEAWRAATPDLVDAEMAGSIYETETYRDAFQGTMAYLTRTMEASCGHGSDGDESN